MPSSVIWSRIAFFALLLAWSTLSWAQDEMQRPQGESNSLSGDSSGSPQPAKKQKQKNKLAKPSPRWGYRLGAHYGYYLQGERGLQTSADSLYEIGEFTGASFFFSAGVE